MKRKIYMVGVMVDERINDSIARNYVQRAVKHFHNETDAQQTFHGVAKPERIAVIDVENDTVNRSLQEMHDFFKTMDRIQGKK